MFEWFKYVKPGPHTREEVSKDLEQGYGLEHFESPHAGSYRVWYLTRTVSEDGAGTPEWWLEREWSGKRTLFLDEQAAFDAIEKIAPLDAWGVIEETGEPNTEPVY